MTSELDEKIIDIFLKYRSPITWYRQIQRQIAWFQGENRFLFHDYRNKTFDILKNILFISKKRWKLDITFATPSEGSGFFKSGMFRMIAYCRPMISTWSPCDYRRQNEKEMYLYL